MKTIRLLITAALLVCAPFAFGQVPLLVSSVRGAAGTAAAPTYTFTPQTSTGFYQAATGEIDVSVAGTKTLQFYPAGQIFGAQGNNYLQLNSSGAVALFASGTNQSITLTPSGTGVVALSNTAANLPTLRLVTSDSAAANGLIRWLNNASSAQAGVGSNFNIGNNDIEFLSGSTTNLAVLSNGHILAAGLLVDGTAAFQLPAGAATTSSGFGFANDTFLYRPQTAQLYQTGSVSGGTARYTVENSNTSGATFSGFFSVLNGSESVAMFGTASNGTISKGSLYSRGAFSLTLGANSQDSLTLDTSQNAQFAKLITSYNGIATAGNGVATIQGAGRVTAQTAANASVATYTVGSADASFLVSANVLVTTSSAEAFTVTVSYTDEGNTARVLTLNFSILAGTLSTAINFANGAVPYEGVPNHIRCKASTAITIKTAAGGTYTGCTYSAEGVIQKLQ